MIRVQPVLRLEGTGVEEPGTGGGTRLPRGDEAAAQRE